MALLHPILPIGNNLNNLLRYQYESLDAPLIIQESDGDVQVIELITDDLPTGIYVLAVSFVSSFTTANDQLGFRVTGDINSPDFLKEAKDENEAVPFSYSFPYTHAGGVFTMALEVFITGVGNADVIIGDANLTMQRVGI